MNTRKEEVKKYIAGIMNSITTGNKNPQLGIEEIEDTLKDIEEIKEFIELVLYAIQNFIK